MCFLDNIKLNEVLGYRTEVSQFDRWKEELLRQVKGVYCHQSLLSHTQKKTQTHIFLPYLLSRVSFLIIINVFVLLSHL